MLFSHPLLTGVDDAAALNQVNTVHKISSPRCTLDNIKQRVDMILQKFLQNDLDTIESIIVNLTRVYPIWMC